MNIKVNSREAQASPEQIAYANLLFYVAWGAILLMTITYFLYVTQLITPYIPIQDIPKYWSLPANEFAKHTGNPAGWGWFPLLGKGDFLNFAGISLLGTLTIIGFLTLVPAYIKKKDWSYLTITILEIVILILAASGILGSGGH